jgi:hypothetical protein
MSHRPSLPDDEIKARVLEALRDGWSYTLASRKAGIDRSTLFRWRQSEPAFEQACQDAIESGLDAAEDAIRRHWRRDWRAAHSTLQARRRNVYGSKVEVTGADGGAIEVAALSEVERAARIAALLAAAEARRKTAPPDEIDELLT